MKAYTDKIDFYRGRYKEQKIKNVCSLEGEKEVFTDLLLFLSNSKNRYCSCILISLLLPTKEILPYLSLCLYMTEEREELMYLINICYRVRELKNNSIGRRLIKGIPNSLSYIKDLSGRDITSYLSISIEQSIFNYLKEFIDKEDAEVLSKVAFYDDRYHLLKIICKGRGWSNASLNSLSLLSLLYK